MKKDIDVINIINDLKKGNLSKYDSLLKSKSKGKWELLHARIEENHIYIESDYIKSILLLFIENILKILDKEIKVKMHTEIMTCNKIASKDMENIYSEYKIKMEKRRDLNEKDEHSAFIIDMNRDMRKNDFIYLLNLLLSKIYDKEIIDVIIKTNIIQDDFFINMELSGIRCNVWTNLPCLRDSFKQVFFYDLKTIPSYCKWTLKIDRIEDDWNGKRHGKIIIEEGDFNEKKFSDYEF